jgi:molybdopterin biosynthesis enzyme
VATVKVIPFAIPADAVREAEAIAAHKGLAIYLRMLPRRAVGVLLVGSMSTRPRLERGFLPAILARIADAGSQVLRVDVVEYEQAAIASALEHLGQDGAQLVIMAGETSIMDRDDVAPRAIIQAGGALEHFGAPVEPGNQLLLAYLPDPAGRQIPVVGAPGCVRSRTTNVVDLVLPRLLAGEHLGKRDIVMLGHGGLLGYDLRPSTAASEESGLNSLCG